MHKSAKNKAVTTSKPTTANTLNETSQASTDDNTNTTNVTNSDKPDNKLNNKPTQPDRDLTLVIKLWPELPDAIRSGIVAIVRASTNKQKSDDQK